MALYSLYQNISEPGMRPRYQRVAGAGAYPKANAVRIFQSQLIAGAFSDGPVLSLRPVPANGGFTQVKASPLPASEQMCSLCSSHLHTACQGGSCNCNCRMFNR